ncbi:MAG: hypothetical protein CFE24_11485 [Flavobacterium sp. BFFFF2]|nr:MAG: hypothetical protein CFE24_11485 [Flavobacterium sp. BFFFF2]
MTSLTIKPGTGTELLLFGMPFQIVESIIGKPDRVHVDEESNKLWDFDAFRLRLTFYEEEDFRLGYMETTSGALLWHNQPIIGKDINEVLDLMKKQGIRDWEHEKSPADNPFTETYFSENQWMMLHVEFNCVARVEWGAFIKNLDEFDWKYNG